MFMSRVLNNARKIDEDMKQVPKDIFYQVIGQLCTECGTYGTSYPYQFIVSIRQHDNYDLVGKILGFSEDGKYYVTQNPKLVQDVTDCLKEAIKAIKIKKPKGGK